MDALHIETDVSDLRQPYLLLTFSGWSDAAGVATAAGRFLVEHLEAERIAQIDPEDFYSFADQRPQAQYNEEDVREIIWPANEFFLSRLPQLEHDVLIGVGVEPHLKWRAFTDLMMSLAQRCNVFQTVTLGALWGRRALFGAGYGSRAPRPTPSCRARWVWAPARATRGRQG